METTAPESILLGKIIGISLIFCAITLLAKRTEWMKIIGSIKDNPTVLYFAILIEFVLGLMIVLIHPIWAWDWPVLITIFGWAMILEATICTLLPHKSIIKLLKFYIKPVFYNITWISFLIIGLFLLTMSCDLINFL